MDMMLTVFDFNQALIVALAAVALGGLVHGTLGTGFPLVSTPIIALLTDVKTAIMLTLLPTLAVNLISIAQGGQWRYSLGRYWPLAVWVLIGSIIGTWWLISTDPAPFKLLLAAIILIYLLTSRPGSRGHWRWIAGYPRGFGLAFGLVAGILAGTVNVAVPPLIIYLTELHLTPLVFVQVLNLCFLSGKAAQVGTFAASGDLSVTVLLNSLPLVAMAVAALAAGIRLRQHIARETFWRALRMLLVVIAGVLIIQYLASVF